jgi:hypothetical protein
MPEIAFCSKPQAQYFITYYEALKKLGIRGPEYKKQEMMKKMRTTNFDIQVSWYSVLKKVWFLLLPF